MKKSKETKEMKYKKCEVENNNNIFTKRTETSET